MMEPDTYSLQVQRQVSVTGYNQLARVVSATVEASSVTETCREDLHAYFNTDNVARALSAALLLLLNIQQSKHRCWFPAAVSYSKALLTPRKVSACPRVPPDSRSEAQRMPPAKRMSLASWRRLLPHAQGL